MKPVNLPEILKKLQKEYLVKALAECHNNKTQAAKLLGLNRTTFNAMCVQHGLYQGYCYRPKKY